VGIRSRLAEPVDAASLAIFRMAIGALIAWEVWRELDLGFIRVDYAEPRYLFRWWLFDWVRPFPGRWLYVAFAAIIVAGLLVAMGVRYLACLFAFLLIWLPAASVFSVDARRKPWVRTTVPSWTVWLLRFQVGVPYFFAGIAKLDFDWLVRAEPLRSWLALHTDFPVIGHLFVHEPVVRLFAFGAVALDLSVPFLLLGRRTRAAAYGFALAFHFMNSRIFNIGIFPWMMILATTIFFEPDWPRAMRRAWDAGNAAVRTAVVGGFGVGFVLGGFIPTSFSAVRAVVGGVGVAVLAFHLLPVRLRSSAPMPVVAPPWRRFGFGQRTIWALGAWATVQILLPVVHFAIPGNAHWTEEGNRFAWHMLLDHKTAAIGFLIEDGDDPSQRGTVDLHDYLTDLQIRKMAQYPDMTLQFARYLETRLREDLELRDDFRIFAITRVSLNGRPFQRIIDPHVDLSDVGRPYLPPGPWIVPLRPYRR
jgi:GNAT superfamily N-acetyltransferase